MTIKTFMTWFVVSALLVAIFGFIVPALISAHDDLAVSLGIGICVFTLYIAVVCGIRMYKPQHPSTGEKK